MSGRFHDRRHAGRLLAERLKIWAAPDLLVAGLTRGGIPVAYEIAKAFSCELDAIVVRKVGVPQHPELALGAVTSDGALVLNEDLVSSFNLEDKVDSFATGAQEQAIKWQIAYRSGRPPAAVTGRPVIVVDDGLATGATMRAAIKSLQERSPSLIVASTPVASQSAVDSLAGEVAEVICLMIPDDFVAVGLWYERFEQTRDDEILRLLEAVR